MQLELTNSDEALKNFFERMEQVFSAQPLPEETFFSLRLALEELLTNVIKYGYDDDRQHVICVELCRREQPPAGIRVRIRDDGHPFNPLTEAKKTETADSLEEQKIGGLGIYLVKKIARDLVYHRENNCNVMDFWIGENAL